MSFAPNFGISLNLCLCLLNYDLNMANDSTTALKVGVAGGGVSSGDHYFFFLYRDFITILCHVGFTILSEQCSQIISLLQKTNPFKVTKYKKEWWIFRPKWAKIKIFAIIILSLCFFPLLLKSMLTSNCLVTRVFQNIFFCVQHKKEINTGLGKHVRK